MSIRQAHAVRFAWSVMALALIALCALPAHAGRSGHRIRNNGSHQPPRRKHAKPAPARPAPANPR